MRVTAAHFCQKHCNDCRMDDELEHMGSEREARWAALLRHSLDGNRVAYVQFLTDIAPVLRGIIRARCGGTSEESEDILQNTLIAIHQKRHTWRQTDAVGPWIYAIARYKVVDGLRKQSRNRIVAFDGTEDRVPDKTIVDPSIQGDLNTLLAHLDDTAATIVRDVKLNGLTAEETGARLNMTGGAVRVALHRAMARLSAIAQHDVHSNMSDKERK
jgi:RNA polymerase sigma factor (sigma-70 family)